MPFRGNEWFVFLGTFPDADYRERAVETGIFPDIVDLADYEASADAVNRETSQHVFDRLWFTMNDLLFNDEGSELRSAFSIEQCGKIAFHLALLCVDVHKHAYARECLLYCLQHCDQDELLTQVQILLKLGAVLMASREFELALRQYLEFISVVEHLQSNQPQRMAAGVRRGSAASFFAEAHIQISSIYLTRGEFGEARKYLEKARTYLHAVLRIWDPENPCLTPMIEFLSDGTEYTYYRPLAIAIPQMISEDPGYTEDPNYTLIERLCQTANWQMTRIALWQFLVGKSVPVMDLIDHLVNAREEIDIDIEGIHTCEDYETILDEQEQKMFMVAPRYYSLGIDGYFALYRRLADYDGRAEAWLRSAKELLKTMKRTGAILVAAGHRAESVPHTYALHAFQFRLYKAYNHEMKTQEYHLAQMINGPHTDKFMKRCKTIEEDILAYIAQHQPELKDYAFTLGLYHIVLGQLAKYRGDKATMDVRFARARIYLGGAGPVHNYQGELYLREIELIERDEII
jgi:tetratricopeptide (TPR) repeat protein